jgi:hypothetical protein
LNQLCFYRHTLSEILFLAYANHKETPEDIMKRLWIGRIVLLMAVLVLVDMPVQGQQKESKPPAKTPPAKTVSMPDLTVADLQTDSNCRLWVTLKNQGKGAIPAKDYGGILLAVTVDQRTHTVPLAKADRSRKLASPGGELRVDTGVDIMQSAMVSAEVDPGKGVVAESNEQNNTRRGKLVSRCAAGTKPVNRMQPGVAAEKTEQVKISALEVKKGQVVVVLEREGKTPLDPSQASTARVELYMNGERKSWPLLHMDPNLRGLNGPRGRAVFATGLALQNPQQVRALLMNGNNEQRSLMALLGPEVQAVSEGQLRPKEPANPEEGTDGSYQPRAMVIMPRGGETWHPGETHDVSWGVAPMDHDPITHWSIGLISDSAHYNVCTSGGACSQTDPNLVSFNPTTRIYTARFTVPALGEVPMGSYRFFVSGGCATASGIDDGCVRDGESLGDVHIALPEGLLEAAGNALLGPDVEPSSIPSRVYVGSFVRLEWNSDAPAPSPGNPIGPRYELALYQGAQLVREFGHVGPRGTFDWVVGDWCALEEDGVTRCLCNEADIRTGENFYIRLTRTTNAHVSAEWGPLSILWPRITVTSPAHSNSYQIGTHWNFQWNTEGLESSGRMAELVLYEETGARLFPIGHVPVREGNFFWTVGRMERPEFQVPAADTGRDVLPGNYFIRVELMGCANAIHGDSAIMRLFEL